MIITYISVFVIALLVSLGLTPLVRALSIKMKWLDKPNYRKINKKPMPLLGGMAIYFGFVAALLFLNAKEHTPDISNKIIGILVTTLLIFLIGLHDDIKHLTARRKLFYQIATAMIAYLFGFSIMQVSKPFGGEFIAPAFISLCFTVFWIVGFTNAVNLLDGLDGLASGVSAIIALSLFFTALKHGNYFAAVLSLALAGSALGFLPFNFYPAKIFMGDTGSMFLGFTLALVSIEGAFKGSAFLTLLVPIIAMGIPVIDTGLSILRRLLKGNGVFKADKEHIHHKLMKEAGSQKKAVLSLYFLTTCFGFIAIGLSGLKGIWIFVFLAITLWLTYRWLKNDGLLEFNRIKKSLEHKLIGDK